MQICIINDSEYNPFKKQLSFLHLRPSIGNFETTLTKQLFLRSLGRNFLSITQ